jgi:hypothetical protein
VPTKASHADWRQAVRTSTGPTSVSPTAPPSAEVPLHSILSESRKGPLGTYIPESIALKTKELSLKLSRERGKRVTISDVVTEALREFLEKHLG